MVHRVIHPHQRLKFYNTLHLVRLVVELKYFLFHHVVGDNEARFGAVDDLRHQRFPDLISRNSYRSHGQIFRVEDL